MLKEIISAVLTGSLVFSMSACSEKKTVCGVEVETAPDIGELKDIYTVKFAGRTWTSHHDEDVHFWWMATKAGTDTWWFMMSGDKNTAKVLHKHTPFSTIELVRVDCQEQKYMSLEVTQYHDHFGNEEPDFTLNYAEEGKTKWEHFPPNKYNYINALVCGRY